VPLVGLRTALSRTTPRTRAALIVAVATVLLAACAGGTTPAPEDLSDRAAPGFFPVAPASQQGELIQALYPIVFYIAVAVFILVEGLLLIIVYRFRHRPTDDGLPVQTHGHNLLEVLWTLIPALIVAGLFVLTVDRLGEIETLDASPDVTIEVTGFQWVWRFDYPGEEVSLTGVGAVGPVMGLPINETVRIKLQAADVIHSFYVPQFLYKKDAVPGRTNEFDVVVKRAGVYTGQCAEFCGLQHYQMAFTVQAMERPDFEAWLEEQRTAEPGASVPPDSATVTLTSVDLNTFDPPTISAPAGKSIVFNFVNADQAQPHNVAIVRGQPDGTDWVGMPIADPGQTATYVAPPVPAGSYEFFCSVHPTTMRGTLTVGGN
jgi:cytochrome c oxidase subunit II